MLTFLCKTPHPISCPRVLASVITLLAMSWGTISYANNANLVTQRQLYQQAQQAITANNLELLQSKLSQLQDYPLKPYLDAQQLKLAIESQINTGAIEAFFQQFPTLPVSETLQQSHLNTLAGRQDWQAFQQAFAAYPVRGSHYRCLGLHAQLNTHPQPLTPALEQQILTETTLIWQQGQPQPKSCDPVFSYWQKKGGLSSKVAETRFWNAIDARNFGLARYAQKHITEKSAQKDAELFWLIRQNPAKNLTAKRLNNTNPHHEQIIDYALKRLASTDLQAAVSRWLTLREQLNLSAAQQAELNRHLSLRLAKRFDPEALTLIEKLDPHYQNNEVTEWRIRLALAEQDWERVAQYVTKLEPKTYNSSRWQYWLAVANEHIQSQAQQAAFEKIAQDRSYYGFLASEQLKQSFSLNNEPPQLPPALKEELLNHPVVQRIQELVFHGEFYYARQEWNDLFPTLSEIQQHTLAHLARDWNWHSQAIMAAAALQKWNDLTLRFPVQYHHLYQQFSHLSQIPLTWALSITRQESAFNPEARSGVGAMGLMQLMPKTARQTAKKQQEPLSSDDQLLEPETNIALGTAYLAQMLERFNGSRIYATAAYNAGPNRVSSWIKARGHLPLDIWIELIPFHETRLYVQRVLEYGVVYDLLAKKPTRLLQDNEVDLLTLSILNSDKVQPQ